MKSRSILNRALVAATAALVAVPSFAHHSFAMYDQTKMLVLTGVVYQFVAQANHAELHIYLLGADGKATQPFLASCLLCSKGENIAAAARGY